MNTCVFHRFHPSSSGIRILIVPSTLTHLKTVQYHNYIKSKFTLGVDISEMEPLASTACNFLKHFVVTDYDLVRVDNISTE